MNYLEYLQMFGVFLGFCQMIPSIYKNISTRNNPIETRAINHLSYSTAILMVYGTLARLPNLVKGLRDGLISGNSVNIRRAVLILLGSLLQLFLSGERAKDTTGSSQQPSYKQQHPTICWDEWLHWIFSYFQ